MNKGIQKSFNALILYSCYLVKDVPTVQMTMLNITIREMQIQITLTIALRLSIKYKIKD